MEGECWVWTAYRSEDGYGRIRHNGSPKLAHRVSYELHIGAIPNGMKVLHSCDKPWCINPNHLFLGTDADNSKDRDRKHRQARGESQACSIFTEQSVIAIRQMRAIGFKIREIANCYNASEGTVANICSRHTWSWLEENSGG